MTLLEHGLLVVFLDDLTPSFGLKLSRSQAAEQQHWRNVETLNLWPNVYEVLQFI